MYIRNTRSSQISQEQRLRELVAEGLEKSNKVKLGDGYLVRIPEIKGRICRIKRGSSTYVEYIYDRGYDPETKQSRNKKTVIGVIMAEYPKALFPNENYEKYFDMETGKLKHQPDGEEESETAEQDEENVSDPASQEPRRGGKKKRSSKTARELEEAARERVMHPWTQTEEEKRQSDEMVRNGLKEVYDEAIKTLMEEREETDQREREARDRELYGDEEQQETDSEALAELIRQRKLLDEEFDDDDSEEAMEKAMKSILAAADGHETQPDERIGNDGDGSFDEEELRKTYEEVNAFRERAAILADILSKIHESIKTQAKKRPDDIISLFKAQKINSILSELKEKYEGTGYDDLLELIEEPREIRKDDEIYLLGPTYSDVEVLLDHYASILHFIKVKKK